MGEHGPGSAPPRRAHRLSATFQPDPPLGRFDNNIARLTVTAGHWRDYQDAAEVMAERVTADAARLAAIVPPDLASDLEGAARPFVEALGTRAFRRPLETGEVDRYAALFLEGPTHYSDLDPRTAGVRLVLEALLQSPHFLYRLEDSTGLENGLVALDGWEIASRLSYALWDTMPDDELFEAARSGALGWLEGVEAQAARLFDHPRAREQLARFHTQAFELGHYTDVDKDATLFPEWSPELAAAMKGESTGWSSGAAGSRTS
jgi:hypothetical protein